MEESIINRFLSLRRELRKDEVWRNVDFASVLAADFRTAAPDMECPYDQACNIPDLETDLVQLENGFCRQPLRQLEGGIWVGGLAEMRKAHPEWVERALDRCALRSNPYLELNGEGYSDGLAVYVPANTSAAKPIQLQSILSNANPLFVQTRNVVVVGRNSKVCLLQCDDSYSQGATFSSNVTEILVEENASVEHYKMQNLNDKAGLLNQTFVQMEGGSQLRSAVVTLNGGLIRNHTEVRMRGEGCNAEVNGLYLNDKEQRVDNYIFVEHACPNCVSNELFKGIIDDSAQATFNGHVLVCDGATKTEAYQSNKNILLTDKAVANTKPFLEIYNDDVKCSHGSTIGQLDEQALFYIRTRGISERTARTLLLYAFCDEVVQKIGVAPLRERLSDMVKRRLHGELTACADCALHCNTPCNTLDRPFKIDVSKL